MVEMRARGNMLPIFTLFYFVTANILAAQYHHPERQFRFSYDEKQWEVVSSNELQKKRGEDIDLTMASMTLVTVQHKVADEKYHARFSVVVDKRPSSGTEAEKVAAYQKHAVEFMKSQRFHILAIRQKPLPKVNEPAFEIQANQRDFGLRFRQVVFLRGGEAYLLTAAARTEHYAHYETEFDPFFNGFQFDK